MFLGMGRYHQDLKIAAPYCTAPMNVDPNMPSAWAGWKRFDLSMNMYGGPHSLI
jgi:hypothetical protein